jgi:hypothetical protein
VTQWGPILKLLVLMGKYVCAWHIGLRGGQDSTNRVRQCHLFILFKFHQVGERNWLIIKLVKLEDLCHNICLNTLVAT